MKPLLGRSIRRFTRRRSRRAQASARRREAVSRRAGNAVALEPLEPRVLLSASYVFPSDAGVLDVTDAQWGAVVNDGQDDTAAIQAAINSVLNSGKRYSHPTFIYLPDGVYNISDSIQSRVGAGGWADGWRAGMILFGESESGVVLKLDDNAAGFQDVNNPKAVILTGSENQTQGGGPNPDGGGNEAFKHTVRNLTVDVGVGNEGAIGINYQVSNRGGIEDVTIRSTNSNSGHVGLLLDRETGPGLIQDVTIEGFDTGVEVRGRLYSATFENITLSDQDVLGMDIGRNYASILNLTSNNTVPVLKLLNDENPAINLIGGDFTGGASGNAAIINDGGTLYLRDIRSSGYGTVVDNNRGPGVDVAGGAGVTTIDEWTSRDVSTVWGGLGHLGLTIEQTPDYHTTDLSKWRSVTSEGATPGDSSDDDLAAIQAAIDNAAAGDEIVYLPNGSYDVSGTIILRGGVKKLMGMESAISKKSGFPSGAPLIRIDDGSAPVVILEHLRINGSIENNTSRTVAFKHMQYEGHFYTANAKGKVFLEDVIGGAKSEYGPDQQVWARQYNTEFGPGPNILNNGGDFWALGIKTEGVQQNVINNGGRMELIGHFSYPINSVPNDRPMIVNNDGQLSVSLDIVNDKFKQIIEDNRGGEKRVLWARWAADSDLGPNDAKANQFGPMVLYNGTDLDLDNDVALDNTADSLTGWDLTNGSWSISSGQVRQSSNVADARAVWNDPAASAWSDYTFAADLRSTDNDPMGLMFGVQDASNYYRFTVSQQSNFRRLEKVVNGSATTLVTVAGSYVTGQTYRFGVTMRDGRLSATIDGVDQLGTISDSTFTAGTVGLYNHWNASTYYDNLLVRGDAGAAPPAGPIDFTGLAVTSYSDQDSGGFAVEDGGATLRLTGNAWKKIELPYNVTPSTSINFEVNAADAGEIIGVSLDNDNDHNNDNRVFHFGGSQAVPGDMIDYSPKYSAGSGWVSYSIPVGQSYTGGVIYLGFVGDDDADSSTDVRFRNVSLTEGPPSLDFGTLTPTSYSGSQDAGSSSVEDGGATLRLTGNAWKKVDFSYTITANTVLEFQVNAADAGEIIGIGFDNDNDHSNSNRVFHFGGSQSVPGDMISITPKYVAASGWVTYTINVGQFYTGAVDFLTFVGDDDADGSTDVRFRNVVVREA